MKKEKKITVSEIVNHIHKTAHPDLAFNWDNVGFQIGDGNQEVKKILLTLDVTENAINKAIKENIGLIISHHPFIFKPLKKITNPLYLKLIKNDIAVFCAHTNLDVIKKGVNSALAGKLKLQNIEFLTSDSGASVYHVAVYVPAGNMVEVANAVFEAGAGIIGNYSNCMNDYEVSGQFIPKEGSNPILGSQNKLEKVVERKFEFFVDSFKLPKVLDTMKKAHPYETPAFAVYPQEKPNENYGLGMLGNLTQEMTLEDFTEFVKIRLKAPFVKLWPADKKKNILIKKVAVCGGSGTSLIPQVYGRADVFVSADFTYHTILDCKIPLIDAGHFYTENPVLQNLKEMLQEFELEILELSPKQHEIKKLEVL
ncbi:MAG: Nif3-like dinuclear metal center hexameric protein [Candidatus Cloacimonetes bacterium]|nr:Nif3-like dinuclear metal center hexameric protein [Candidatus Cloacimonadota bacterium]MCF7813189.1 Nif3-like dinuclear metal center hexameric protein [Candidatus Cloacimonadota bacterium]MCF7867637.1 Nif3-like dinuclear metal center hexameric protein [Candidatus Cloacimonadota bacterium]MCF7883088.1 Nif3-like dinuclear metal center hexameric protein [Candidatus Cloacimonadota bacterium]